MDLMSQLVAPVDDVLHPVGEVGVVGGGLVLTLLVQLAHVVSELLHSLSKLGSVLIRAGIALLGQLVVEPPQLLQRGGNMVANSLEAPHDSPCVLLCLPCDRQADVARVLRQLPRAVINAPSKGRADCVNLIP